MCRSFLMARAHRPQRNLRKPDHKYHELFEKVRNRISGVCSYCAGAFKVKEKIEAANLPLSDQFKGHPSFKQLIDRGFDTLAF